MPYLKDDPEQDTELSSAPGGGSVGGSAPTSAPARGASPNTGTGFVNLQQVLGLNAGQGAKLANGLAGNVAAQGQGVTDAIGQYGGDAKKAGAADFQSFDPTRYGQIQQQAAGIGAHARALGSFGGEEAALAQQYGQGANGGYSGGQQGFDAFLAGSEGAKQMQGAANAYGGLDQALGLAGQSYVGGKDSRLEDAGNGKPPTQKSGGINYTPGGFGQTPEDTRDTDEYGKGKSRLAGKNSPYGF